MSEVARTAWAIMAGRLSWALEVGPTDVPDEVVALVLTAHLEERVRMRLVAVGPLNRRLYVGGVNAARAQEQRLELGAAGWRAQRVRCG